MEIERPGGRTRRGKTEAFYPAGLCGEKWRIYTLSSTEIKEGKRQKGRARKP